MLSRTPTRGRNVSMWSSWKLDTSSTATPWVGTSRAPSENAVPMLPATSVGRLSASNTCPSRLVVVVLPLVPVIATIGALQNHDAASISETTGVPRSIAARTSAAVDGTPGDTTIRSQASETSPCPPNSTLTPTASISSRTSARSGPLSVSRTPAPADASRRAAAIPLRAAPTTVMRLDWRSERVIVYVIARP